MSKRPYIYITNEDDVRIQRTRYGEDGKVEEVWRRKKYGLWTLVPRKPKRRWWQIWRLVEHDPYENRK